MEPHYITIHLQSKPHHKQTAQIGHSTTKDTTFMKTVVHPYILLSFTNPHVVSKPYDFIVFSTKWIELFALFHAVVMESDVFKFNE